MNLQKSGKRQPLSPGGVIQIRSAGAGLELSGSGRLVWERRDGDRWTSALDAGYVVDADATPPPVVAHSDEGFVNTIGMLVGSVSISIPTAEGSYRVCSSAGDCVEIQLTAAG